MANRLDISREVCKFGVKHVVDGARIGEIVGLKHIDKKVDSSPASLVFAEHGIEGGPIASEDLLHYLRSVRLKVINEENIPIVRREKTAGWKPNLARIPVRNSLVRAQHP